MANLGHFKNVKKHMNRSQVMGDVKSLTCFFNETKIESFLSVSITFSAFALFHFGEFLQVSGEQFGAADVISHVDFLVLRMRSIISRAHWQQHHILACGFLECESNGNGTTLPRQVRLNAVHELSA